MSRDKRLGRVGMVAMVEAENSKCKAATSLKA